MDYFPRVGMELSAAANVRFRKEPKIHRRPAYRVRYDNLASSARFTTSGPLIDFTIVFSGPAADVAVMTDFFSTFGVVTTFLVDHPELGEGVCRLKLTDHPIEPATGGAPGEAWDRITIPIEGAF